MVKDLSMISNASKKLNTSVMMYQGENLVAMSDENGKIFNDEEKKYKFTTQIKEGGMFLDTTIKLFDKNYFMYCQAITDINGKIVGNFAASNTDEVLNNTITKMFLNLIDSNLIPYPGTAIGKAIELAIKSFSQKERKYKVLILLSDGEDHNSNPLDAADEAKKEGIIIYTIGIGTPEGDVIPAKDENDNVVGYKKDKSQQTVMSKLDETTLQKIALVTGGKYYRSTSGELEIDRIYEEISSMEKKELKSLSFSQYEHRFKYFLLVAFLLLVTEFVLSERKRYEKE